MEWNIVQWQSQQLKIVSQTIVARDPAGQSSDRHPPNHSLYLSSLTLILACAVVTSRFNFTPCGLPALTSLGGWHGGVLSSRPVIATGRRSRSGAQLRVTLYGSMDAWTHRRSNLELQTSSVQSVTFRIMEASFASSARG